MAYSCKALVAYSYSNKAVVAYSCQALVAYSYKALVAYSCQVLVAYSYSNKALSCPSLTTEYKNTKYRKMEP